MIVEVRVRVSHVHLLKIFALDLQTSLILVYLTSGVTEKSFITGNHSNARGTYSFFGWSVQGFIKDMGVCSYDEVVTDDAVG